MKFSVYNSDDHQRVDDVSKHDVIGEIECCLADIVTVGQQYTRNLRLKGGCVKVGVSRWVCQGGCVQAASQYCTSIRCIRGVSFSPRDCGMICTYPIPVSCAVYYLVRCVSFTR